MIHFFGKKGIIWHGAAILYRKDGMLHVMYVHPAQRAVRQ